MSSGTGDNDNLRAFLQHLVPRVERHWTGQCRHGGMACIRHIPGQTDTKEEQRHSNGTVVTRYTCHYIWTERMVTILLASSSQAGREPGSEAFLASPHQALRLLVAAKRNPRRKASRTSIEERYGMRPLTARETDVMHCVSRGLTNDQIAAELHISPSSVKTHLGSVMRKYGTHDRRSTATIFIQSAIGTSGQEE